MFPGSRPMASDVALQTYFYSPGVATFAKSHVFANNQLNDWGEWGWGGGHTVRARGGHQGSGPASLHAAGKALYGGG